jgi:periplasmic copper chaperone A
MKRSMLLLAVLMIALPSSAAVSIGSAWVREPNPARDLTAAFMTLKNHGTSVVSLVRVSSASAEVVEMHETTTAEGMTSMRKVDGIAIPPGSAVKLEPGGFHLMLIGLQQKLVAGSRIVLHLEFDDGTGAKIEAEVRGGGSERHHHHAH